LGWSKRVDQIEYRRLKRARKEAGLTEEVDMNLAS
jgi:hypothetical protein